MNIKLFWRKNFEQLSPICETDFPNVQEIDVLACLFMDDGGLTPDMAMSWIDEGLKKIEEVTSGQIKHYEWDREAWGANISKNTVTLYSLLDESCSQLMDTNRFKAALYQWKKFLTEMPCLEKSININV